MDLVMDKAKEKLMGARKSCPGMSEEIYAICDYIAQSVNDSLVPQGLMMGFVCVLDDIQKGRCGFGIKVEFPQFFLENKNKVLEQAPYFPQVIDAIADKEFAESFRALCKTFLKYSPPRRVNAEADIELPEYARVAVDWWAKAILSPRLDNGEDMPDFFVRLIANSQKEYSEEEIKKFKNILGKSIIDQVEQNGLSILEVDYGPCSILADAGSEIGIDPMVGWPWKTSMHISKGFVKVSSGFAAPWQQLWMKA